MMSIRLKTKVALGSAFLFLLLLLTGVVSFYYFYRIKQEARDMLSANYETITFSKAMQAALNDWPTDSAKSSRIFLENLQKQKGNITEPGEKQLTTALARKFAEYRLHPDSSNLQLAIQENIAAIVDINLQAIMAKQVDAGKQMERAQLILTVIIALCILAGFTFLFNFPSMVADPVSQLTQAIRAIANKNYSQRIQSRRTDEFGEMATAFNIMAEQLDRYEHSNLAKIMFEKQRAETVIQSLKDASIGVDNRGTILFANNKALQLLNLNERELIGKTQREISDKNDLFKYLMEAETKAPFKIVVDGKEHYFIKEHVDIGAEGELLGKMISVENITPYKETDVAKTHFIATISHELKTPLASADFSLKLLEDERVGKLNEEQKLLVKSLKSDNQRLLRMLSELLDLAQVETGRIQLKLQTVSVAELFEQSLNSLKNTALEKSIRIRIEMPSALPRIEVDPEKTTWIVNNFLSNAIRYSPQGSEISLTAQMANQMIELGVKDLGIGIPNSYQQQIFERFFRVPGTKERKGTGLGLAISKEFTEAMGGQIGVISEPGRGSYFYCRFRVASTNPDGAKA